jgi:aminoglycoside phosphotransferase (APT) family kinase protein
VRAIIDWELSTLGDPLADFTYYLMAWDMPVSQSGAGPGSLLGHDLASLGIPSRSAMVEAYVAAAGFNPRPHLDLYLAYNFFRMAAIVQGIVGRARDGTAASQQAVAWGDQLRPLAAAAWRFAEAAGAER